MKAAADEMMAAALLGEGWTAALADFARAAGARHAVLMRNMSHKVVTSIANEEAGDAIAQYMAGDIPPNTRYARVDTQRRRGFRVDHDDYSEEELARDPYYQEFLRPNAVFWHANAVLAPGRDEYVELSLKRGVELGPYSRGDIDLLNRILPELNAVARVATRVLDAEARGMANALRRRGGSTIQIDRRGHVLPGQDVHHETNASAPLRIAGRRLVSADRTAQPRIDRAVADATATPGRLALTSLQGADGRRYLLQVHPVPGVARDVFLSAQAIAMLLPLDASASPRLAAIRDAFALTTREGQIACLMADGLDVPAIAMRLGIRPDTVRPYLRNVFAKTGTRRQLELVALLARIGG